MDRLHPTSSVASRLGISYSDVLLLIRRGTLRAKRQVLRGEGKVPRLYVLESSLNAYLNALPDGQTPAAQVKKTKRISRTVSDAALRREIAEAKEYV